MPEWKTPLRAIPVGQGRIVREGEDVAILTIGAIGNYAVQACQILEKEGFNPAHYDMRFVKPLDEKLLLQLAADHSVFVSVEDNAIAGGAGSAINEFVASQHLSVRCLNLGLPDNFIKHGTQQEIYTELGLDSAGILSKISTGLN